MSPFHVESPSASPDNILPFLRTKDIANPNYQAHGPRESKWGWVPQKQTKEFPQAGSDKQSSLSPEEILSSLYPIKKFCFWLQWMCAERRNKHLKIELLNQHGWDICWVLALRGSKKTGEKHPLSIHDNPSKTYLWMGYWDGHPSDKPESLNCVEFVYGKIPVFSVSALCWRRAKSDDLTNVQYQAGYIKKICKSWGYGTLKI